MRIVVISDTHLSGRQAKLPDKLLEDIKSSDMVIHAGDFVESEFLEKLKTLSKEVKAVWGNMDSDELKKKLPQKEVFNAGRYRVGVTHGSGSPGRIVDGLSDVFKNDRLDLIIFGHSHVAFNQKIGNTIFFNPGSPFDKAFSEYNSYGVIEINDTIEAKIERL